MRVTTPTLLDKVVDFRVSENAEIEHEDFIKIWREIFFQESLYNLYYDHNFFIQTQYLNILLTLQHKFSSGLYPECISTYLLTGLPYFILKKDKVF